MTTKTIHRHMKSKILSKWPLLILGIAVISSASIVVFFLTPAFSSRSFYPESAASTGSQAPQQFIDATSSVETAQVRSGLPIRLKIPEINVDAAIEDVGLTTQGAMDVPSGPTNTAWFDLGPRPGENGTAVIAGHEGWKDGIPAVFDDLHTLLTGDKIYVEDDAGTTATFVVRSVRTYGENASAPDVFASNDGKTHLNLITCEGIWSNIEKSYSNRLVVFADEE